MRILGASQGEALRQPPFRFWDVPPPPRRHPGMIASGTWAMEHDAPWDEIARAWHDGAIAIAQIAAQYGLTKGQLTAAAKARGWPTRGELRRGAPSPPAAARAPGKAAAKAAKTRKAKSPAPKTPGAEPAAAAPAKAIKPAGLVKRIYNTIEKELSKLDAHGGRSSQDRERASRALCQLMNSLEKAVEMQREIDKQGGRKQATAQHKEALKHAEELRREIADRLERLHRKRAAAK